MCFVKREYYWNVNGFTGYDFKEKSQKKKKKKSGFGLHMGLCFRRHISFDKIYNTELLHDRKETNSVPRDESQTPNGSRKK